MPDGVRSQPNSSIFRWIASATWGLALSWKRYTDGLLDRFSRTVFLEFLELNGANDSGDRVLLGEQFAAQHSLRVREA